MLVLDLHSYNYRRDGPDKPGDSLINNRDVNVGTGTMERERWASLVDSFIAAMRTQTLQHRPLDVRENVKFKGGFFPLWLHSRYPNEVCVLSLEFKKFFMDEWSATANITALELRLRTLAARVVAVRLVTDGAEFGDVFDVLRSGHQFSGRSAFIIATRVCRGGGLTKDVVYLRGLKDLLAYLREGHPFEQLLAGKFSLSQLPAIKKLAEMGQLAAPKLLPAYLHNAAAQLRLIECSEVPLDGLYQRLVA